MWSLCRCWGVHRTLAYCYLVDWWNHGAYQWNVAICLFCSKRQSKTHCSIHRCHRKCICWINYLENDICLIKLINTGSSGREDTQQCSATSSSVLLFFEKFGLNFSDHFFSPHMSAIQSKTRRHWCDCSLRDIAAFRGHLIAPKCAPLGFLFSLIYIRSYLTNIHCLFIIYPVLKKESTQKTRVFVLFFFLKETLS